MKIGIIIGVIALFAGGLVWYSQGSTASEAATRTISDIESDIVNGAQLIDVRTPEEFDAGHIDQAILLPLQSIEAGIMPAVDKDDLLYLYCRSGNRSAEAKALLEDAGYQNIVDLGAIESVAALGGTIVQ